MLWIFFLNIFLGAFEDGSQNTQKFEYKVDVVLKLIQVHVSDKEGKPVKGLTKDDFTVRDDGKPVTITDFEIHDLTKPAVVQAKSDPASPSAGFTRKTNRKFMILFDFAYNTRPGLLRSKEVALEILDRVTGPEDEIGIMSFALTRGLRIHEFFTIDHKRVRRLVESIGMEELMGRAGDVEARYAEFLDDTAPGPGGLFEANKKQQIYTMSGERRESQLQAMLLVKRLSELARALRYVPGRKNILLFSSGIPASLIYGIGEPSTDYDNRLKFGYEEMAEELAAADCSVFSFDAREVSALPAGMSGGYSMKRLSDKTAGRYFPSITATEKNVEAVQEQTGYYYVLGYPLKETWDGRYRKLKVEVARKGCVIRVPDGYYSPKRFKDFSAMEKSFHLVDLALSERPLYGDPLRFSLRSLPTPVLEEGNVLLLAELPVPEIRSKAIGKAELVDIVFGADGKVVSLRGRKADFSVLGEDRFLYVSAHKLKPGAYAFRMIVRDLETGVSAVASHQETIREEKPGETRIYPPLWLIPGREPPMLFRGFTDKKNKNGERALSELFGYNPAERTPLIGAPPPDAVEAWAILPCMLTGGASALLEAAATVPTVGAGVPGEVIMLEARRIRPDLTLFYIPIAGRILRAADVIDVVIRNKTTGDEMTAKLFLRRK